jgi:UDP-glucose 4-epimerase
VHGVRTVCLRLTNTYGPRQMMKEDADRYAMIYGWLRRVIEGEPLPVMGGHQVRDFTYVEDCVDALLRAAAAPQADGEVYNLGGEVMSLMTLADVLIEVAGDGRKEVVELPVERRAIDPGKVYVSYDKIRRELGWEPRVGLRDGLARTIAYYREFRAHYWHQSDVAQQQVGGLQYGPLPTNGGTGRAGAPTTAIPGAA